MATDSTTRKDEITEKRFTFSPETAKNYPKMQIVFMILDKGNKG